MTVYIFFLYMFATVGVCFVIGALIGVYLMYRQKKEIEKNINNLLSIPINDSSI